MYFQGRPPRRLGGTDRGTEKRFILAGAAESGSKRKDKPKRIFRAGCIKEVFAVREKTKSAQIFEAAAGVFAEKGFHAATVEEIASRAGIGKGTVYEYFPSKEALFRAMLKAGMQSYLAAVRERLKRPASARGALEQIALAHACFVREKGALARLIADEQGCLAPWAREWVFRMRERKLEAIAKLIARGAEQGEFRPVNPRLAAEVFLGVVGAICLPALFTRECASGRGSGSPAHAGLESRMLEGLKIFFHGLTK
ncbi:MAG TPA: TetR/AcrR family transcriptional regulator [Syntrophomonadaceae bacterium]|nr:TetR/AcrR family transcriptional regulator [Syntrophomonadaceae bacterium]